MVLLRFLPRSEYFDFYLFKLLTARDLATALAGLGALFLLSGI